MSAALLQTQTRTLPLLIDPPETSLAKHFGIADWGYVVLGADGEVVLNWQGSNATDGLREVVKALESLGS